MRQRVPPGWMKTTRPHHAIHLLIEDGDPALAVSDLEAYKAAGLEVAFCQGPSIGHDDCPLLSGSECALVAGADVVLQHLDRASGVGEAILGSPQAPPLLTVGGPDADLPETAPVSSRIRAVTREATHWIARPDTSSTV